MNQRPPSPDSSPPPPGPSDRQQESDREPDSSSTNAPEPIPATDGSSTQIEAPEFATEPASLDQHASPDTEPAATSAIDADDFADELAANEAGDAEANVVARADVDVDALSTGEAAEGVVGGVSLTEDELPKDELADVAVDVEADAAVDFVADGSADEAVSDEADTNDADADTNESDDDDDDGPARSLIHAVDTGSATAAAVAVAEEVEEEVEPDEVDDEPVRRPFELVVNQEAPEEPSDEEDATSSDQPIGWQRRPLGLVPDEPSDDDIEPLNTDEPDLHPERDEQVEIEAVDDDIDEDDVDGDDVEDGVELEAQTRPAEITPIAPLGLAQTEAEADEENVDEDGSQLEVVAEDDDEPVAADLQPADAEKEGTPATTPELEEADKVDAVDELNADAEPDEAGEVAAASAAPVATFRLAIPTPLPTAEPEIEVSAADEDESEGDDLDDDPATEALEAPAENDRGLVDDDSEVEAQEATAENDVGLADSQGEPALQASEADGETETETEAKTEIEAEPQSIPLEIDLDAAAEAERQRLTSDEPAAHVDVQVVDETEEGDEAEEDDRGLPTMEQLEALSRELDDIDAVLARMDAPEPVAAQPGQPPRP